MTADKLPFITKLWYPWQQYARTTTLAQWQLQQMNVIQKERCSMERFSPACARNRDEKSPFLYGNHQLSVCVFQAGFFKRNLHKKKEEEINRDSWDYVPKSDKERESTS